MLSTETTGDNMTPRHSRQHVVAPQGGAARDDVALEFNRLAFGPGE